jgi:hypothetical protein
MKTKTPKISQSLMKSLDKYLNRELCGYKFVANYIDGASGLPSEAMDLGNWFEYIATGQLPRDGKVPYAKKLKSGKLAANYQRMEIQAQNFKGLMTHHNFEIISTGHAFNKNNIATGIADIIARKDGKLCVVDLKSSGLLDDKWSEFGWNLDFLEEKHNLMIQAVHYKILAEEEFGEEVDFYFCVHSTKNEHDQLLIKVNIDSDTIETHNLGINNTKRVLENELNRGFKPYPKYKDCRVCFLKEVCSEALKYPEINVVNY